MKKRKKHVAGELIGTSSIEMPTIYNGVALLHHAQYDTSLALLRLRGAGNEG